MAEHLLCDDSIRVSIDGHGERTLIALRDGASIRFWIDTVHLEEILEGGVVQISAHGGHLTIDVEGDQVRIDFEIVGVRRKSCVFSRQSLVAAVATVRSHEVPEPPSPPIVVGG
ncbi:MAG: hypothetical protein ACO1SV_26340 [Fimbriimonas sp.]